MVNETDLANVDAELGRRSLSDFTSMCWGEVENRPYDPGWHMDAICDHLQAVSSGEIRNIIINIPPRHTKSLLCNVFWPSWDWINNSWRSFLFASYGIRLSLRDNRKAKRLVESEFYQRRWNRPLASVPRTDERWGLHRGGERLITSVGGASSTGEGADVIVIDDPISADEARSDAARQSCLDWWDETIKSRFNDQRTGAFVIIMQRLHEDDLTGHILANETGFDHLCLPARYEPEHPHPVNSSIGFKDPRTKPGELLNPVRFGEDELNRIAKPGTYAEAGQLQQRPAPRGGGLFQREWFIPVRTAPNCLRYVRGWDLAATEDSDAAYTCGVLMGLTAKGEYVVIDVVRDQVSPNGVEKLIRNTAKSDFIDYGGRVMGSIPQDPGAGGKAWAQALVRAAAGYNYRKSGESGDKVTRAAPFSAQAENDNVMFVKADWNKAYFDELAVFPASKFKDQVDASSRAFMELTNKRSVPLEGTYG